LAPLRVDRIVDAMPGNDASDSDESVAAKSLTRIDPFRSDHPATKRLADNEQLDLASTRIRRHFGFATNEDAEGLSVLLRLSDGSPLAVENFVGAGRVIVQAVPLRLQWSDLARTQSFVVMVRDWIEYLAQPRATQYNLEPGQPIVYRLSDSDITPGSGTASTTASDDAPTGLLQTPRRESIELTAQPREQSMEFRSSQTRLPGAYRLEIGLGDRVVPYQVMRSPEESNLASLDPDLWQRIEATLATGPSAERLAQASSTQADPVWPYLLIALIVLITGELVLSGVMARERFGSSGIPEFSESLSGASPLVADTVNSNASAQRLEAEVR